MNCARSVVDEKEISFPRHTGIWFARSGFIAVFAAYSCTLTYRLIIDVLFLRTFGEEMVLGLPVSHPRCVLRTTTWETAQIFVRLKRRSSAAMDFCAGLLRFVQGSWP